MYTVEKAAAIDRCTDLGKLFTCYCSTEHCVTVNHVWHATHVQIVITIYSVRYYGRIIKSNTRAGS